MGTVHMENNRVGAQDRQLIRGYAGVAKKVHKSRTQLWRDVRAGRFPAPFELGSNSVAWFADEIDDWVASRPRRAYGSEAV